MKKITLLCFMILTAYSLNAQDTCAGAVAVTPGITTVGTIDGTDVPSPICALNGTVDTNPAGEWYSYTSSQDEVVTVTTDLPQNDGMTNSNDTRVHIYTGSCGSLTCVAGNDDIGGGNFLSEVQFLAESGVTYYIAWDNRWNPNGFDFNLSTDIPNCTTSFPYVEDFDNAVDFVGCYTVIDEDGNGTAWIQQELELQPLTPSYFATNGTNDAQKEDYLFSPALTMTAGNTYDISVSYNGADTANGAAANEDLEVLVASGNTVADANSGTSVFTDTNISQNGAFADVEAQALTGTGQFVPSTSGDYHIVFKSTGSPAQIGGTTGFLLVFEYSIDETLSTEDFETFNFNYFVDVQNKLNLSANQAFDQVTLHNLLGQQVLSQELSNQNESVDLNNLSSGVYLAQVQINDSTKTFKIVKK
ncbi:T9SS type A sorting domain-containing protein [Mesohalobacter halotolerans]|uniref:T9SS type A sorting domain-containing protein n=1 Tax=Mesohalobacter halotolerans TaxID=1883405 RepID=A0A4U5TSG6_9FLAO|nr:T9SS type A sorting domain-containing protein [Mesohalobacter halotolerans]TKS56962.1 T9SS type A sorting domain-containing protein [Mesohalobacter halotolerans]